MFVFTHIYCYKDSTAEKIWGVFFSRKKVNVCELNLLTQREKRNSFCYRIMAAMSERDKRALKRQRAQLEMEKEELVKKIENQRKMIETLQDERRKKESKSEDVDRDGLITPEQIHLGRIPDDIKQTRTPRGASGGTEDTSTNNTNSSAESSQMDHCLSFYFKIVDEVGESPDKQKDYATRSKEMTTPGTDFETRYRKLKQTLTDSLARTRALTKTCEEQTEKAWATDTLSHSFTDKEDEDGLSLAPYLIMDRGKKLLYEEEVEDEDRIDERLSRSVVDDSHNDVFLPTELDIEEKKIIDRVKKLRVRRKNAGGRK